MTNESGKTRAPFLSQSNRLLKLWRRLRAESGSATIELALVTGIFGIPLLLGTFETGMVIYNSIEVSNAAHAGAAYGMMSSTNASDTTHIVSAAQNEAPDFATNLTATPTAYYACSLSIDGTQYTTQSAATAACTGVGNHALEFIQVMTSATVPLPIRFVGLPASITLRGNSIMEVQE
jgi:Flp pilus assembly protein TadG